MFKRTKPKRLLKCLCQICPLTDYSYLPTKFVCVDPFICKTLKSPNEMQTADLIPSQTFLDICTLHFAFA